MAAHLISYILLAVFLVLPLAAAAVIYLVRRLGRLVGPAPADPPAPPTGV